MAFLTERVREDGAVPVEVRPGAIFAPFGGICSRYGTYMSLNVPLGARKCEETAPFSATALSLPRMTDHEFEKLDAEFQRRLRGRRKIPPEMTARLVSCRDCDRPDPEFYMVKRELWLQAVPSGRGCLCIACLSRRLKRPLTADDFTDGPR